MPGRAVYGGVVQVRGSHRVCRISGEGTTTEMVNMTFFIHIRGSFRKIVKRGQKLMVEKFGGRHWSCSNTLHSAYKFQGEARFWQEGANFPPFTPP